MTVEVFGSGVALAQAMALLQREEYAAAAKAFTRAIGEFPNDARAWLGHGISLCRLGRIGEGIASARHAGALTPADAAVHYNLGVMLALAGRRNWAIESYRRAARLQQDHAAAHVNRALLLLKLGRYREGWAEYEWRFELGAHRPGHGLPIWTGEPLRGRRLLLHMEAGFGDAIQMVRFVPCLAEMGAFVGLECKAPLVRLFRTVPGVAAVHAMGDVDPREYDLACGSFSIPHRLGTTSDTLPRRIPYLAAEGRGPKGTTASAPLNVGVVWAGDPNPGGGALRAMDRKRSLPFSRLERLLAIPGVRFHSLQVGEAAAEAVHAVAAGTLADPLAGAVDFADTAAVVEGLDLVISVDTAVAHVAGALGRPVWLLSRFDGCWRWIEGRSDTPWYPTMSLFHQPSPGDWGSVLDRVAQALERAAVDRAALFPLCTPG